MNIAQLLKWCAGTFGICAFGTSTAQVVSEKEFLAANSVAVTANRIDNPLFDKAFYANQLFFFGENHGAAEPQAIDIALFKLLHSKAGVRLYIAEVDATKAWMLNQYLSDGKTAWLDKVFASWKADTAQWANKEYYQKFEQLRTFFRQLPQAQQFKIVGIDVPQDYSLLHEQSETITGKIKFGKFQLEMDSLQLLLDTLSFNGRSALADFAKRLLQKVMANEAFFAKQLHKNYLGFKHLLTSFTFLQPAIRRDSMMFKNMMSLININKWQTEKMYGFLGFFHCLQANYQGSMPFACQLNTIKAYSGKIASMQMLAIDSKVMLPYIGSVKQMMPRQYAEKLMNEEPSFVKDGRYIPYGLSNDNQMMKVDGISELKDASQPNSITLFRLTGSSSPYNNSNKLAQVTGFQTLKLADTKVATTNIFQYVLLFRNTAAATPLNQ